MVVAWGPVLQDQGEGGLGGRTRVLLHVCSVALFVARTPVENFLEQIRGSLEGRQGLGHRAWEEEGRAQAKDSAEGWRRGTGALRPRRMWHLTGHEDGT